MVADARRDESELETINNRVSGKQSGGRATG